MSAMAVAPPSASAHRLNLRAIEYVAETDAPWFTRGSAVCELDSDHRAWCTWNYTDEFTGDEGTVDQSYVLRGNRLYRDDRPEGYTRVSGFYSESLRSADGVRIRASGKLWTGRSGLRPKTIDLEVRRTPLRCGDGRSRQLDMWVSGRVSATGHYSFRDRERLDRERLGDLQRATQMVHVRGRFAPGSIRGAVRANVKLADGTNCTSGRIAFSKRIARFPALFSSGGAHGH